ncbi:hypothetical protein PA05_1517 [Cutibacterium acnes P05]|jgi:hypothetical protein|nr:hypothetical protein [Cutibacterium acnes P05]
MAIVSAQELVQLRICDAYPDGITRLTVPNWVYRPWLFDDRSRRVMLICRSANTLGWFN